MRIYFTSLLKKLFVKKILFPLCVMEGKIEHAYLESEVVCPRKEKEFHNFIVLSYFIKEYI